jgi:hypothetical protein
VTDEITALANAMIFDGMSAELREGCIRVAAGVIVEVGERPEPGWRAGQLLRLLSGGAPE